MGVFCLLVELLREGSAPAACAAGLFNHSRCQFKAIRILQFNFSISKFRYYSRRRAVANRPATIDLCRAAYLGLIQQSKSKYRSIQQKNHLVYNLN